MDGFAGTALAADSLPHRRPSSRFRINAHFLMERYQPGSNRIPVHWKVQAIRIMKHNDSIQQISNNEVAPTKSAKEVLVLVVRLIGPHIGWRYLRPGWWGSEAKLRTYCSMGPTRRCGRCSRRAHWHYLTCSRPPWENVLTWSASKQHYISIAFAAPR